MTGFRRRLRAAGVFRTRQLKLLTSNLSIAVLWLRARRTALATVSSRNAAATLAIVAALQSAPACGGSAPAGTLVVLLSSTQPGRASAELKVHSNAGWTSLGRFSGDVPAAPITVEAAAADVKPGTYDALEIGGQRIDVRITVASGRVATAMVGVEQGQPAAAEVYAGQQAVNLGLRELSGRYARLPQVSLRDQHDRAVDTGSWIGHVVVVSDFSSASAQQAKLLALYRALGTALPPGVELAEVSSDPQDTPSVLAGYSADNQVGWQLMTGEPADVASLLGAMGAAPGRGQDGVVAIVDGHGFVVRRFVSLPDSAQVLDAITNLESPLAEPAGASAEPQFKVTSWGGGTLGAASFAGRPLVLNFWASWCTPCRTEMPLLDAAARAHPGIAFVFVDERDDSAAARQFVASLRVRSPIASDADGSAGAAFGVAGLPTTVFIRPEGTIESTWIGQLDSAVLERHLAAISP
jgi:thiol-disulfide isomerase/thioredoxin